MKKHGENTKPLQIKPTRFSSDAVLFGSGTVITLSTTHGTLH